MDGSILVEIKKLLGIDESDESFDTDLIIHINSTILVLKQLGVNVPDAFTLSDDSDTWSDLCPDQNGISAIKSWLFLKVRKIFDPPQSSVIMSAIDSQIQELEWRINVEIDYESSEEV